MSGAMALHMALSQSVETEDRFTGRGTHEGCGECCSRFLPLADFEVRRLSQLGDMTAGHPKYDGAIDMTCPFLDSDRNCAIYDDRPIICRAFDCADWAKGGVLSAYERMPTTFRFEMRDMREVLDERA